MSNGLLLGCPPNINYVNSTAMIVDYINQFLPRLDVHAFLSFLFLLWKLETWCILFMHWVFLAPQVDLQWHGSRNSHCWVTVFYFLHSNLTWLLSDIDHSYPCSLPSQKKNGWPSILHKCLNRIWYTSRLQMVKWSA